MPSPAKTCNLGDYTEQTQDRDDFGFWSIERSDAEKSHGIIVIVSVIVSTNVVVE
jgi:hypothetical protein